MSLITVSDDEGDDRDLFYLVTAFSEFSKKIIHMAFKQLLWRYVKAGNKRTLFQSPGT